MNAGHADLESNRVQHQHAEPVPIESRYASAGSHYMPESRSSRHMAATWSLDLNPVYESGVLQAQCDESPARIRYNAEAPCYMSRPICAMQADFPSP